MAHSALAHRPPDQHGSGGRSPIKMISAVIRPYKLDVVKDALNKLTLVGGVTLTTVRGFGHQRGSVEHYMGVPYSLKFLDKVKIEIAVAVEDVPQIVNLISNLAHTGKAGDGKIFVMNVNSVLRIRTGEQGIDAL